MSAEPTVPTGSRRGARLGVLLAVLTTLFLVAGTGPAQAHDALLEATPAADQVLATAPSEVQLGFSGAPVPLGTEVLVLGPDGADVASGAAEVRGSTVVQQLSDTLAAGAYTVEWRSTSSDGHPLSGSYTFTVTTGTSAPATSAADPSLAAAGARTPDEPAGGGPSVGWLLVGALALGAVAAVAVRLRRRS